MSMHSGRGGNGRLDAGTALIGVGSVMAIVGAFLPWLTVGTDFADGGAVSGFDMVSDAVLPIFSPILTVGLALVAIGLALGMPDSREAHIGEVLIGVVIALVAATFIISPETVFGGGMEGTLVGAFTDPGLGIFATVASGVTIAVGGIVHLTN